MPLCRFAPWLVRPLALSPPGLFASWFVHPLADSPLALSPPGLFAPWLVRPQQASEQARGQTSQGRKSQGTNRQRGEKAIIHYKMHNKKHKFNMRISNVFKFIKNWKKL